MLYKDRLVELRENAEIKQFKMADILNIYKGVYNQYETEYVIMPIKHLNFICNYFNVSLDYIFGFTKKQSYKEMRMDIDKVLSGKRLKEFRKENKIRQVDLAFLLNVSRTTIAEYERGTNIMATPFLYTFCKNYNISADYLLGRIDKPKFIR